MSARATEFLQHHENLAWVFGIFNLLIVPIVAPTPPGFNLMIAEKWIGVLVLVLSLISIFTKVPKAHRLWAVIATALAWCAFSALFVWQFSG